MAYPQQPGFVYTAHQQQPAYPSYPSYPSQHGAPDYKNAGHQPFPAPIQHQPGQHGYAQQSNWFANPNFQDYLRHASSFHVKQKVELLEAIVGFETENKYTVKDQNGNKVFVVIEESNVCGRLCLGSSRPFTLRVKDVRGMDVIVIERGFDCTCCCGLFCADSVKIKDGVGNLLGTVVEECSLLYPMFKLHDAAGALRMKADGPACPIACGGNVTFRLTSPEGSPIGQIAKEWGGLVRELFTDADYFSISFPQNLDPNMKAVCLGLLFMIVSILQKPIKPSSYAQGNDGRANINHILYLLRGTQDFHYFERGNGDQQGGRRLFG